MSESSFRRVARTGLAPLLEDVPEGPEWNDLTPEMALLPSRSPRFGWLAGIGAAVAVLIVIGVAAFLTGEEPVLPPATDTTEHGRTEVFRPPTRTVNGETFLDLTLLDGSRITLAYPADLDLTSKGVEAQAAGGVGAANRTVITRYGPPEGFISQNEANQGSGELTNTFMGPDGGIVERWDFPDIPYLVFDFSPWTAYVWDTKIEVGEVNEGWAQNLHGTTDADGFLVLTADPPLELVDAADDPGPDGPDIRVDGESGALLVFINDCDRMTRLDEEAYGNEGFAFCDEPTNTLFAIFGAADVQEQIHKNLRVNPDVEPTTTTSLPEDTEGPRFVPDLLSDGSGRSSLDVAFLDGTTANLSWPEGLDLLSDGVTTHGWGAINSLGSGTSRTILAIPETADSAVERFGIGELIATYPDSSGGTVEFRRFPVDATVDYLVFDMGQWTVLVYDYQSGPDGRMSESSRETWARSLSGQTSPEGFVSLSAEAPLVLAGPRASPPVSLGFESPNGTVDIKLFSCEPNEISEDDAQSISWCEGSGKMFITVRSTDAEFRNAVREGLTVSDVVESQWGTPEDRPETGSDWQVIELAESSIVLTYPADWQLADENLTPNLSNPRESFSLGTFALTPGGPNCAQAPTQALHDLARTDVFLTVQERSAVVTTPSGFDPRPENFGPTPGSGDNALYDCLDPEERSDLSVIHWIWFTDAERYFHVLVAIGEDADPVDVATVWETLDRLVILPPS